LQPILLAAKMEQQTSAGYAEEMQLPKSLFSIPASALEVLSTFTRTV